MSKTLSSIDKENRPANHSSLNLDKLNSLCQLNSVDGTGFLKKLISIYLASAPISLAHIEKAIQAGDNSALNKAAHAFKSSTANIGAETLADICQKLENHGKNHQIDEASKLLPDLQHELRQVTLMLEALLKKDDSGN